MTPTSTATDDDQSATGTQLAKADDDQSANGTELDEMRMADWVAAVDQHRARQPDQPQPTEWSRRHLGLLVCVVALIFPIYSYLVQREMVRAETAAAQEAMEEELRRLSDELARTTRTVRPPPATSRRPPPPPVRIVGVIDGTQPTAIAQLHGRSPSEVAPSLCVQAEQWLKRDLADQHIRIQEDRGDQPAQNAGVVWCG